MTLEEIYRQKCNEPSDINEHLPTLRDYASRCRHVTEFGVRGIVSTWALLLGLSESKAGYVPRMVSYDLTSPGREAIEEATFLAATRNGGMSVSFTFITGDTRQIAIEETCLLFIDTFHTYNQLHQELNLHGNKARKFIIMHDTETFGRKGEAGDEGGLLPAIDLFMAENPHWKMRAQYYFNNGLTILERK